MNDNLGIGVMSSVNFKERYTSCKLTWLKDFDNTYIFGGHNASSKDKNLISIENAGEDWESCFLKQQMGLKYMYDVNPDMDWYSISGCDNVLFKNKVVEELNKFDKNLDILLSQPCGLWTDYPNIHEIESEQSSGLIFRSIAGGASFFISNSLMKKCYPILDEFNDEWKRISGGNYGCADVGIAYMIKKYFNVDVTHVLSMLSQNPSHYENPENDIWYRDYPSHVSDLVKSPMSLHYIRPNEMEYIYKKYSKL
jgi:hypothetical protein